MDKREPITAETAMRRANNKHNLAGKTAKVLQDLYTLVLEKSDKGLYYLTVNTEDFPYLKEQNVMDRVQAELSKLGYIITENAGKKFTISWDVPTS